MQRSAVARRFPEHNKNWLDLLRAPPLALPESTLDDIVHIERAGHVIHGRDDRTGHFERSLQMVAVIRTHGW